MMPSSGGNSIVHYWAGKGYPIGWLFTPTAKRKPKEWLPFALDNGKFASCVGFRPGQVFLRETPREWSGDLFLQSLSDFSLEELKPRWVTVPDVVADKEGTLKEWGEWYPRLSARFNFAWAFVVQDGMTPEDVPEEADVVFVGGSKKWKFRNLEKFAKAFPRVHVGGVYSLDSLIFCESLGVESVDGTGWFRNPTMQEILARWFRIQAGEETLPDQMTLALA